jgi:hypothetical protein
MHVQEKPVFFLNFFVFFLAGEAAGASQSKAAACWSFTAPWREVGGVCARWWPADVGAVSA